MLQIDMLSKVPVYEQIISQIERLIMLGVLREGDKIPSVRSLALQLSINPNTIQKAVSIMDQRGIIMSASGRGCFVRPGACEVIKQERRQQLGTLKEQLSELKLAGITAAELHAFIDELYSEGVDENDRNQGNK